MLPKEAVLTGPPKQQVTLLPPLPSADALSIVDLGGGADVSRRALMLQSAKQLRPQPHACSLQ